MKIANGHSEHEKKSEFELLSEALEDFKNKFEEHFKRKLTYEHHLPNHIEIIDLQNNN